MQDAWSDKREPQDSYEEQGVDEDEAQERAAWTVSMQRREAGETTEGR